MNEHSDKSELYLNGVLRGSSDYVSREADEPINIQYYGKTHNIADLHTLVSVRKRPPRSEAPGIACTEPWTSNDEPRDRIRIDGLNEQFANIQIGIFVPPEVYERLYNIDLNACDLYIDTKFLNTGENQLKVDKPASFLFAYLSEVSVRIVSIASQNEKTKSESTEPDGKSRAGR
jgi:hypothetical protein